MANLFRIGKTPSNRCIICYAITKTEIMDDDFHSIWSCSAVTADDSCTKLITVILKMLPNHFIEISEGNNIQNHKDDLVQIILNLKSENVSENFNALSSCTTLV